MKTQYKYYDELKLNELNKSILNEDRHREDGPSRGWDMGEKWWYYNDNFIMETKGDVTPEQLLEFKLRIL